MKFGCDEQCYNNSTVNPVDPTGDYLIIPGGKFMIEDDSGVMKTYNNEIYCGIGLAGRSENNLNSDDDTRVDLVEVDKPGLVTVR